MNAGDQPVRAKEIDMGNDKTENSVASHFSSRAFRVGDCVNLNQVEQPCAKLIAVVVADDGQLYHCQYLNADPMLDSYNNPPMKCSLDDATKIADFGVVIRSEGSEYWCEQRSESKATYKDGKPRKWQDWGQPKFVARRGVADLVWPF